MSNRLAVIGLVIALIAVGLAALSQDFTDVRHHKPLRIVNNCPTSISVSHVIPASPNQESAPG